MRCSGTLIPMPDVSRVSDVSGGPLGEASVRTGGKLRGGQ